MPGVSPAELMQLAIDKCRAGIAAGQSPFGCAIARGGEVVSVEHNTVLATLDITAHAEINALRVAAREQGVLFLEGAVVATTCEPCPMCTAALHWSRVREVHYGATIADAQAAGFNEMQVSCHAIARLGGSRLMLTGGLLADACRALFTQWQERPDATTY